MIIHSICCPPAFINTPTFSPQLCFLIFQDAQIENARKNKKKSFSHHVTSLLMFLLATVFLSNNHNLTNLSKIFVAQ